MVRARHGQDWHSHSDRPTTGPPRKSLHCSLEADGETTEPTEATSQNHGRDRYRDLVWLYRSILAIRWHEAEEPTARNRPDLLDQQPWDRRVPESVREPATVADVWIGRRHFPCRDSFGPMGFEIKLTRYQRPGGGQV